MWSKLAPIVYIVIISITYCFFSMAHAITLQKTPTNDHHHDIDIHFSLKDADLNFLKEVDTLIVNGQFKEARFQFISHFEGSTARAVDVGDGKKTIGYGLNMSNPKARWAWGKIFANEPIKDAFDDFYKGKKALTPAQQRLILEHVLDDFAPELDQMGFNTTNLTPYQRISIASLYYNGGKALIFPNLTHYVVSGKHQMAFNEILTNSVRMFDKGKPVPLVHGLQNRRLIEAALYAGPQNFERVVLPQEYLGKIFQWLSACFIQHVNPNGEQADTDYLFDINVRGITKNYQLNDIKSHLTKETIKPVQEQLKTIHEEIRKNTHVAPVDLQAL